MYRKYLFIGLGGSGGKTLRFLKRDIRTWLNLNGAAHLPIPQAWQFLHIDTPTNVDGTGLDPAIVPMLDTDEYLGLVSPGISFGTVQSMLDNDSSLNDETQTWRVEPAALGVPIGLGAGQFRAIGRTIATTYLPQIKNRLDQSIARIRNGQSIAELTQLYQLIEDRSPGDSGDISYVIISSLAGGTGAGLLFPVADLVRGIDSVAGGESVGLLYTPEVFESLGGAMTGGVQANSLAAISELLNGYWWGGSPNAGVSSIVEPKTSPSLRRAGVPNRIARSGPAYPFLIGRTGSGGVTFGSPEDLFEMVGRTLVSWVVDPSVSDVLNANIIGNWGNAASTHQQSDVLVFEPSNTINLRRHEVGLPNISGIGFARVGVGTDWFEKYSSRRLALDGLRLVARAHLENPQARYHAERLNSQQPDEIVLEWARELMPDFLRRAGLSEMGPTENQIQESMMPPEFNRLKEVTFQKALDESGLNSASSKKIDDWRRDLESALSLSLDSFRIEFENALMVHTERWVAEAPVAILRQVELQVSLCGLKTTAALVREAAHHLAEEVVHELETRDLSDYERWANSWVTEMGSHLSKAGGGKVTGNHPSLQQALSDGHLFGTHFAQAKVVEKALQILPDFARNFLVPLSEALEAAQTASIQEFDSVEGWPEWSNASPPKQVCPPATEYTIISPEEFNGLFEQLLEDSVSGEAGNAVREFARADVISGAFLRDQAEKQVKSEKQVEPLLLISAQRDWWPAAGIMSLGLKPQSRAYFKVRIGASDFEERALAWLRRPNTAFAELLDSSLRTYLGDTTVYGDGRVPPHVYEERQSKFVAQLRAAFASASPLVNINRALLAAVHPQSEPDKSQKIISQIPLQGHALESQIRMELGSLGVNDGAVAKALGTSPSIRHVDVTSFLWPPHSVLTIDSLLRPISSDWNKSVQSGMAGSFWSRRRSTRIQEFAPVPQAVLVSMVRGWFVAGIMGLLDRRGDQDIRMQSHERGTVAFPSPTLSISSYRDDHLPRVIESLALAYVECITEGSLLPLEPYRRLRDLGRSPDGSMFRYDVLGTEFAKFLETGECSSLVKPLVQGGTKEERVSSSIELLSGYMARLARENEQITEKRRLNPSLLSDPPLYTGLFEVISKAIDDLLKLLKSESSSVQGEGL